jgi:hypothetical protein
MNHRIIDMFLELAREVCSLNDIDWLLNLNLVGIAQIQTLNVGADLLYCLQSIHLRHLEIKQTDCDRGNRVLVQLQMKLILFANNFLSLFHRLEAVIGKITTFFDMHVTQVLFQHCDVD